LGEGIFVPKNHLPIKQRKSKERYWGKKRELGFEKKFTANSNQERRLGIADANRSPIIPPDARSLSIPL